LKKLVKSFLISALDCRASAVIIQAHSKERKQMHKVGDVVEVAAREKRDANGDALYVLKYAQTGKDYYGSPKLFNTKIELKCPVRLRCEIVGLGVTLPIVCDGRKPPAYVRARIVEVVECANDFYAARMKNMEVVLTPRQIAV
jgi:hypothetical protein